MAADPTSADLTPRILPIGDGAVLVRFAETLSASANVAAIGFAKRLEADPPSGVVEIAPGLVSVLVRIVEGTDFWRLSGELSLRLSGNSDAAPVATHDLAIAFDGEDLDEVAGRLALTAEAFIEQHNAQPLRVLATGFAPGFAYCGFHPDELIVPRREHVRPMVPAGSVLFAAGQTAIAATPIRTGWHIIGRTSFRNFDPDITPPTKLNPSDLIRFGVAP